jgi:hypothetical protein
MLLAPTAANFTAQLPPLLLLLLLFFKSMRPTMMAHMLMAPMLLTHVLLAHVLMAHVVMVVGRNTCRSTNKVNDNYHTFNTKYIYMVYRYRYACIFPRIN